MKFNKFNLLTIISALFVGCTNYFMDAQTLVDNLNGNKKDSLSLKNLKGAGFGTYNANNVKWIKCYTADSIEHLLENSPSVEMKIYLKSGGIRILHFDTVYLKDSLVYGCNSRIFQTYRSCSINDIKSIKIQNGHKDYRN